MQEKVKTTKRKNNKNLSHQRKKFNHKTINHQMMTIFWCLWLKTKIKKMQTILTTMTNIKIRKVERKPSKKRKTISHWTQNLMRKEKGKKKNLVRQNLKRWKKPSSRRTTMEWSVNLVASHSHQKRNYLITWNWQDMQLTNLE